MVGRLDCVIAREPEELCENNEDKVDDSVFNAVTEERADSEMIGVMVDVVEIDFCSVIVVDPVILCSALFDALGEALELDETLTDGVGIEGKEVPVSDIVGLSVALTLIEIKPEGETTSVLRLERVAAIVTVKETTEDIVEEEVFVGKLLIDEDIEESVEIVFTFVDTALDENEKEVVIDLTLLDDMRVETVVRAVILLIALGLIDELAKEEALTSELKDSSFDSAALVDDDREG